MINAKGRPITGSKPQMRSRVRPGAVTKNSREAQAQVKASPAPFASKNSALFPVPTGPTAAGSGYAVDNHPAGRNGEEQGTDLTHDQLLAVGYERKAKGHHAGTHIKKLREKYSGIYGSSESC